MGVSRALSAFRALMDTTSAEDLNEVGCNPGHDQHLNMVNMLANKRRYKLSRVLKNITRSKNLGINRVKNLFPKSRKVCLKQRKPKTPSEVLNSKYTHHDADNGNNTTLAWVNWAVNRTSDLYLFNIVCVNVNVYVLQLLIHEEAQFPSAAKIIREK